MTNGHAIITGGSSGIGFEIARLAAAQNLDLTLLARRRNMLSRAVDLLRDANPDIDVSALSVDVADQVAVAAAIERSIQQLGPPTHLVTSAGVARARLFIDTPSDIFKTMMEINFHGTVNAVQAVYPVMRAAGKGRIGMIASGAALVGVIGYAAYGSSKFAVRGFAESLRGEARKDGITISLAFPPDTDTPQLHEENLDKPAETRAVAGAAKTWSAPDVAKIIWTALNKGRFAATPGWEMTILHKLHSVINPILQRHFDHLASEAASVPDRTVSRA